MTEDPKISGRYRELPREEPPRALDDAILAASRRAVDSRPAPLVVPTGRRRWYFPVAAAAIIVLAVAVTVHVERERPGEEIVSARVEPQKEVMADQAKSEPARRAEPRPFAVEPPPPPPLPPESREAAKAPAPAAAPPSAPPQRALGSAQDSAGADRREKMDALAKRADEANAQLRQAEGARARSEVMARAVATPASRFARAAPEQWLLAIDDLKRQGKHEEAERELAEFRKRHPNYRIPEAITEKFERR